MQTEQIQTITYISVTDLKPYQKNNKNHPAKQVQMIADSISQFGFRNPIIIDKNNEIIAGHGRLLGAKQLGIETVPCIIAEDLTEDQVRAYRLLDNRIGDFGEYDIDSITEELKDIGNLQLGLDSLDDLFTDLLPEKENEEVKEDDYEVPEEIKTDIVIGDLFEIGEHRLLCGDSTDREQVALLMNGEKADMVFTDPPYNMGYKGTMSNTTVNGVEVGHIAISAKYDDIKNDKMSEEEFNAFISDAIVNIKMFCEGAYYISFGSGTLYQLLKPLNDLGIEYKSIIIWMKNQSTISGKDFKSRYEPIVYGRFNKEFYGERFNEEDIWEFQRTLKNDLHPTMKPVPLIEKALKSSSKEGMKVLDLFGGSGSTMVACHQLNRKCYMSELDPKYCQVIIDRMLKLDPTLEIKKNGLSYNPIHNG